MEEQGAVRRRQVARATDDDRVLAALKRNGTAPNAVLRYVSNQLP
jgi:hypothetical protein